MARARGLHYKNPFERKGKPFKCFIICSEVQIKGNRQNVILRNKRFGDQVETDNRTRNLCHLRGISTLDNFFQNTSSSARSQSRNNFQHFTRAACKEIVSESPGLVDFSIGPAIFVLNLPDGQVLFLGEIQITEG